MRNALIQEKKVITVRDLLNKEMLRLQKLCQKKPFEADHWAREEFGDNLDMITPLAIERNKENCRICGKDLDIDEYFMRLSFSFCVEYPCHIDICSGCLHQLSKEI